MLPLVLALQLSLPVPHLPSAPRLQLASFRAPTLKALVDLQLPPPVLTAHDPDQGGLRMKEVGAGFATAMGASAASVFGAYALGKAMGAPSRNGFEPNVGATLATFLAMQLLAVPAAVALVEDAVADGPLAGSLARAMGYAYLAQAVVIVAAIALSVMVGPAAGLVAGYAVELAGLPVAVSLGLHGGDGAERASASGGAAPALAAGQSPLTSVRFSYRF